MAHYEFHDTAEMTLLNYFGEKRVRAIYENIEAEKKNLEAKRLGLLILQDAITIPPNTNTVVSMARTLKQLNGDKI